MNRGQSSTSASAVDSQTTQASQSLVSDNRNLVMKLFAQLNATTDSEYPNPDTPFVIDSSTTAYYGKGYDYKSGHTIYYIIEAINKHSGNVTFRITMTYKNPITGEIEGGPAEQVFFSRGHHKAWNQKVVDYIPAFSMGMPTPVLPGCILKRLRLMEREQRQDLVLIYTPWAIINTIIMMKVCTI